MIKVTVVKEIVRGRCDHGGGRGGGYDKSGCREGVNIQSSNYASVADVKKVAVVNRTLEDIKFRTRANSLPASPEKIKRKRSQEVLEEIENWEAEKAAFQKNKKTTRSPQISTNIEIVKVQEKKGIQMEEIVKKLEEWKQEIIEDARRNVEKLKAEF
ncbi:hypothetical protein FQR65_LT01603 [Abscondita terminalis]|nr:hypothetical protein FQR65_LT01603 [Abscondita terminalis]